MADRTVSVKFQVDTGNAEQKIGRLQKATEQFGKAGSSLKNNKADWDNIATAAGGAGLAVGAGLAAATSAYMNFDKAMSGVKSVSGATAAEFENLRAQAIEMGAATQYSASEAALAQEELAKAGLTASEILGGGLEGALSLAAAGGLELADAATIASNSMNMFGLEASDVGRVADVLANGANKSATDVGELGQGLSQVGTIAAQTGLSLEETTAALSMFADQGIKGSDAGTSLKTMLQRLTPQSKEAAGVFEELGFSAYDAQGNFIGLEALAGELQSSFGGLDTESRNAALGVAFGSDAIRGASILMDGGAAAARDYTAAMSETGTAAEVAATRMDNLAGDVEALKGSLETALIGAGSSGNDALRDLVQGLTGVVNAFSDLPGPMQEFIVKGAAVTAGAGLLAGAGIKAATTAMDLAGSLRSLADASPTVARGLSGVKGAAGGLATAMAGPWGLALAGAATAVAVWSKAQADAEAQVESLRTTLNKQTGALTANSREWFVSELNKGGVLEKAKSLGLDLKMVTDAAMGNSDAVARMNAHLDATVPAVEGTQRGLTGTQRAARGVREAVDGTNETLAKAREQNSLMADALGEVGGAASTASTDLEQIPGALTEVEQQAQDAAAAFDGLKASIEGLGSTLLGARGSARSYEEALDAASDAAAENGRTLDITTEAGRSNQAALDSLASSTTAYATAALEAGASSQEVASIVGQGRAAFVEQAEAMGMTAAEAAALADSMGLIPSNVQMMFESAGIEGVVDDVNGVVDYASTVEALIQMGADPAQAEMTAAEFVQRAAGTTATVSLAANPSPFLGTLGQALGTANSSSATSSVLANVNPFFGHLAGALQVADASYASATVGADTGPATSAVSGFTWWAGQQGATVNIRANITRAITTVSTAVGAITAAMRGGYATGGWTGPGSKFDEAGIVHRDEFVHTKAHLRRPGYRAFHQDLWATNDLDYAYLRHKLRGYADGGSVGHRFVSAPSSPTVKVSAGATTLDPGPVASAIASQVAAAVASYRPVVEIAGTKFYGVMKRSEAAAGRAGAR